MNLYSSNSYMSSIGPAKVSKVKIFSGPCYRIKCVLTFVSGVQESVLVDFISQNKHCIVGKILLDLYTGHRSLG